MKDPAFLFYTNDFDSATKFFSHEQVGMYMRLLMAQHQHGHLTEKQMLFICGIKDEDVFSKFTLDEQGKYYNERLLIEISKRRTKSEISKENIAKRWNNTDTIPNNTNSNTETNTTVLPTETETERENKTKTVNEIVLPFTDENFVLAWNVWIAYRKEIKKPYKSNQSIKTLLKQLSEFNSDFCIVLIERSMSNGWQGLIYEKTGNEFINFKNNNNGRIGTQTGKQHPLANIKDLASKILSNTTS